MLADDDFGVFRMIQGFLAMTDVELAVVAADFPKQIDGTVARIARLKRRLAGRYDPRLRQCWRCWSGRSRGRLVPRMIRPRKGFDVPHRYGPR